MAHPLLLNEHTQVLLEEFYLGDDDITVYRAKDGYQNRFKKGDIATFSQHPQGYYRITIPRTRKMLKRSNLLCLLRGIPMPEGSVIDHINGDTADDVRGNLRVVTSRVNNCNRVIRSDNTTGTTGITWHIKRQRYIVRRTVKGTRKEVSVRTLDEAQKILVSLTKEDTAYTVRHGK